MTIKDLRTRSKMTQKQFAEFFGIPQRSIENWEGGQRKCPQYLLDLMEYKLKKENIIKDEKQQKMKEHLKDLSKMQAKISQIAADKEAEALTDALKNEK